MRTCALFLLVTVFLMFLGSGLLGGSIVWHLTRKSYYFWVTELGVEMASCVMLVAGSLLCFPSSWVAYVAVQRPKPLTYVTLMILLSSGIFLFATGLTTSMGLSKSITPAALKAGMTNALKHSGEDPNLRSWFGVMQSELKCCGVVSHTDWLQYRSTLPPSCCRNYWVSSLVKMPCQQPLFLHGCLKPAYAELTDFVASTVTYATSLIVIMAVALFVVAYMIVSDSEDESKQQRSVVVTSHAPSFQEAPHNPHAPFYQTSLAQLL